MSEPEPAPEPESEPEPEQEPEKSADEYDQSAKDLATIDGEGDTDLRAVKQRSGLLDVLERKCPDLERSDIADISTVARQELAKTDIDATTYQVMRGLNKSIAPSLIGKLDCREVTAAYIIGVQGGSQP